MRLSIREILTKRNCKDKIFLQLNFSCRSLLINLGFEEYNKGKTSGSRIIFIRKEEKILLHKPHPNKEMPLYAVRQLKQKLVELGDLK